MRLSETGAKAFGDSLGGFQGSRGGEPSELSGWFFNLLKLIISESVSAAPSRDAWLRRDIRYTHNDGPLIIAKRLLSQLTAEVFHSSAFPGSKITTIRYALESEAGTSIVKTEIRVMRNTEVFGSFLCSIGHQNFEFPTHKKNQRVNLN